jgi:hypothetical protein
MRSIQEEVLTLALFPFLQRIMGTYTFHIPREISGATNDTDHLTFAAFSQTSSSSLAIAALFRPLFTPSLYYSSAPSTTPSYRLNCGPIAPQIYHHTFYHFKQRGTEAVPVDLEVSFGKGEKFWTNVFPTELVDKHRSEIKRFQWAMKIMRWTELFCAFLFSFLSQGTLLTLDYL